MKAITPVLPALAVPQVLHPIVPVCVSHCLAFVYGVSAFLCVPRPHGVELQSREDARPWLGKQEARRPKAPLQEEVCPVGIGATRYQIMPPEVSGDSVGPAELGDDVPLT